MTSEEEVAAIGEGEERSTDQSATILDFDDYLLNDMCGESFGDDDVLINLCVICGRDMGSANPRQMCGKTYCMLEDEDSEEKMTTLMHSEEITMPDMQGNYDILAAASTTLGMPVTSATTPEKVEKFKAEANKHAF